MALLWQVLGFTSDLIDEYIGAWPWLDVSSDQRWSITAGACWQQQSGGPADQNQVQDEVIHACSDGQAPAKGDGTVIRVAGGTCSFDGWWKSEDSCQGHQQYTPAVLHVGARQR